MHISLYAYKFNLKNSFPSEKQWIFTLICIACLTKLNFMLRENAENWKIVFCKLKYSFNFESDENAS